MRNRIEASRIAALLGLVVLLLGACASKTGTGALVGAGAGAVTGGVIAGDEGALIGGILGAALGAGIGYRLELEDQRRAAYVLETTPTRETEVWMNPDTGTRYEMTPTETYRGEAGLPCREFTFEAYIGGRPQETWGTACRQPDGSWRVVSTS